MKQKPIIFAFILLILTGFIYSNWLGSTPIASGDFSSFASLQLQRVVFMPFAWDPTSGSGFGQFASPFSWLFFIMVGPQFILGRMLGLNWALIERFTYLYPLVISLLVMPIFLYKRIFPQSKFFLLASFLFAFNTYILMLIGGGQIYIALSYALASFILGYYISKLLKGDYSVLSTLVLSILLSFEVMLDLRITYVLIVAVFFLVVFTQLFSQESLYRRARMVWNLFVLPGVLTGMTQAFWVLPTLLMHQNPANQLGSAYNTLAAVRYFSFAKFEDTMGLLHPNWPENIFGFVHFMKPEFLLLPILAYGALLFVRLPHFTKAKLAMTESGFVVFFALLGLIGAFLAKGANDPFGGVYLWLFGNVPGFVMFRDPTKWYVLIALSYSVLIPFTVEKMYEVIERKSINLKLKTHNLESRIFNFQNAFLVLVLAYLLLLIRPAVERKLTGTFQPHAIPHEYITLENYLSSKNWGRTFWVPSVQRFAYNTPQHPAVGAEDFYHITSVSGVLTNLQKQSTEKSLQILSIKYIIVPYDVNGELFVKDRKYDNSQYLQTLESLKKISWLKEIPGFGRTHVFALSNVKDHFWLLNDAQVKVFYQQINPTKYFVKIMNAKRGDRIVFTDSFDSHWQMIVDSSKVNSHPFEGLNSFVLPKNGNYSVVFYYAPQTWVNIGLVISGITLAGLLLIILRMFVKL